MLELGQRLRHDLLHELATGLVDLGLVDHDLADVVAQVVAQRADDDVRFLIDQERRLALGGRVGDRLPDMDQIVQVPLQLFGAAAYAGGAHDDTHALGHLHLVERLAQFVALLTLDAAGYAAGAGIVGHEHQIAPGQADEGGERGALVAALLLLDLDDDLLALGQGGLDAVLAVAAEVVLGDLLEREEAVPIAAVVDEGGFQTRLDAGDAPLVDVGLALLAAADLDV